MITKTEFVNYAVEKQLLKYNKETDMFIIKEGYEISAEEFFKEYQKKTGQSFEGLYDEHVSCFCVVKCTECGTVIFEYYDERYEHNLKCPICTDYKTGFEYWTKEEIEKDCDKQKAINTYLRMTDIQEEDAKRYEKRGNRYDFEKTHRIKILKNKKWTVDFQLIGYDRFDLRVAINVWKQGTLKHAIAIPISPKTGWLFIKNKTKCKVTWKNV